MISSHRDKNENERNICWGWIANKIRKKKKKWITTQPEKCKQRTHSKQTKHGTLYACKYNNIVHSTRTSTRKLATLFLNSDANQHPKVQNIITICFLWSADRYIQSPECVLFWMCGELTLHAYFVCVMFLHSWSSAFYIKNQDQTEEKDEKKKN